MCSDFVGNKPRLIELARAIAGRANSAAEDAPAAETEAMPAEAASVLEINRDLDPQAVVDFAVSCRRKVEQMQRQVSKQLDAMLLLFERFDVELAALRGEVDGLREEQRQFMKRLGDAEDAVRSDADELANQLSARFMSHLETVDHAAEELMEGRRQFADATAALLDRLKS